MPLSNTYTAMLSKDITEFTASLQNIKRVYRDYLPDVRAQKEKETTVTAAGKLKAAIEKVLERINKDIEAKEQEIYKLKFPRSYAGSLLPMTSQPDSISQQMLFLTFLNTNPTYDQVLFQLDFLYRSKLYDTFFLLVTHIESINRYKDFFKDSDGRSESDKNTFFKTFDEIAARAKAELKIIDLEKEIELLYKFKPNVQYFITALDNQDWNSLTIFKNIHGDLKKFLYNSFPELYKYIFHLAYPGADLPKSIV